MSCYSSYIEYTGELSEKVIFLKSLAPKKQTTTTTKNPQVTGQQKLEISNYNI